MFKGFGKNEAIVLCDYCDEEYSTNLNSVDSKFDEFWGEYYNPPLECPHCGAVEIINVNLPEVHGDVPYKRLSPRERTQRSKVQQFIMMVREDYTRPKE